jgi:dynein assembly factor with WDR repeat domains 1
MFEEPMITEKRKKHIKILINSKNSFQTLIFQELIKKLESKKSQDFGLFKTLRAHVMPLTNCAFNKSGDKFITGSYDRTCKIWDTQKGEELFTLEGHKNVVYTMAFNNPFGNKIGTGSFDKTAKI